MALYYIYRHPGGAHQPHDFYPHGSFRHELGYPWRDDLAGPRWPSLYWALVCLTFWTLLVGPVYRRMVTLKTPVRVAARSKAGFRDAGRSPGGYLGG